MPNNNLAVLFSALFELPAYVHIAYGSSAICTYSPRYAFECILKYRWGEVDLDARASVRAACVSLLEMETISHADVDALCSVFH